MTVTMPDALALLRAAADAVELAARNDRETIGELATVSTVHDGELAELRDEVHALGQRVASLDRILDARTSEAA